MIEVKSIQSMFVFFCDIYFHKMHKHEIVVNMFFLNAQKSRIPICLCICSELLGYVHIPF
jgi:hypothetical protein